MAKKKTVAVAISPDRGLEVAEMDYTTGTIAKYTQRKLDVVTIKSVIPDMDIFKDLLQECFIEIGVSKGSNIVLCLPTVTMGVGNYMASQTDASIIQLISDDLIEKDLIFRDSDPLVVTTGLSVSIQSKVVAYTAAIYSIIQEAAKIIVDLGYRITAIDMSVSSVFRALIHTGKIQAQQDTTWLMLLVDGSHARLISLNGETVVEYKEEQIMFDFSDTSGNCDMVAHAIEPYLEKYPAKYLFVVSRTDNVSAEMLASKIKYNSPVIFLEANTFAKEGFIEAPDLPSSVAESISLELIGACFYDEALLHFNLYNEELGDVYWDQQPPQFEFNGKTIVVTVENLIKWVLPPLLIVLIVAGCMYFYLIKHYNDLQEEHTQLSKQNKALLEEIAELKKKVSVKEFDEGTQIKIGVGTNTQIYNYFDMLGKEMPQKVWLSSLELRHDESSDKNPLFVNMEGQADNIESIYTFYRNMKDAIVGDTDAKVELQKLALASSNPQELDLGLAGNLPENGVGDFSFDENSNDIILSSNADYYEFIISNKSLNSLSAVKEPKVDDKKKKSKKK